MHPQLSPRLEYLPHLALAQPVHPPVVERHRVEIVLPADELLSALVAVALRVSPGCRVAFAVLPRHAQPWQTAHVDMPQPRAQSMLRYGEYLPRHSFLAL